MVTRCRFRYIDSGHMLCFDGGKTTQRLLRAGLIDQMIISEIPMRPGCGQRLLGAHTGRMEFALVGTETMLDHILKKHHRRRRRRPACFRHPPRRTVERLHGSPPTPTTSGNPDRLAVLRYCGRDLAIAVREGTYRAGPRTAPYKPGLDGESRGLERLCNRHDRHVLVVSASRPHGAASLKSPEPPAHPQITFAHAATIRRRCTCECKPRPHSPGSPRDASLSSRPRRRNSKSRPA
jgi:hypothetical protein